MRRRPESGRGSVLSVIMGMQEDTANCQLLRPLSIILSMKIKPFFRVGRVKRRGWTHPTGILSVSGVDFFEGHILASFQILRKMRLRDSQQDHHCP